MNGNQSQQAYMQPAYNQGQNQQPVVQNRNPDDLYYKLLTMFPYTDKNAIKNLLQEPPFDLNAIDEKDHLEVFAEHCLDLKINEDAQDYIPEMLKKNPDLDDICKQLEEIFPNADPYFIYTFANKNYDSSTAINEFIEENLKNPKYPTNEKCLQRYQIKSELIYEFKIDTFLDFFPDPFNYFEDPQRKCKCSPQILGYLNSIYEVPANEICTIYKSNNHNVSLTVRALERMKTDMEPTKFPVPTFESADIEELQEIAFIKNQDLLRDYLRTQEEAEQIEFDECMAKNTLFQCECCFGDAIPLKMVTCSDAHIFCKDCIEGDVNTKIADGVYTFECISKAGCKFNELDVKKLLKSTMFNKFYQKYQEAEVKSAGIGDLVSCPFCSYSCIPPGNEKFFVCANIECKKISCRLCKKLNHSPFTCEEVDPEKARHYLEEEMTRALLRKCGRCQKPYIKVQGCNYVKCSCGATMCYSCNQLIRDKNHYSRCIYYTVDNYLQNEGRVQIVAAKVSEEINNRLPDVNLETEKLIP